jgi:hypothetical protein
MFAEKSIECIMDSYTDLLNMGVDIEDVEKEYVPGGELERAICVLLLASIKEVLDRLINNMNKDSSQSSEQ